eukprot:896184-Amphidinium_carterae.2
MLNTCRDVDMLNLSHGRTILAKMRAATPTLLPQLRSRSNNSSCRLKPALSASTATPVSELHLPPIPRLTIS